MNVSAVLVTRGDVPLDQITDSITAAGIDDIVVWSNAEREDLGVYGRYAGIAEAKHDLIYVQDDDCVVSDPMALVREWEQHAAGLGSVRQGEVGSGKARRGLTWLGEGRDFLVANQPEEFRHQFYREHSLVGFGAVFHRDAPWRAFVRFLIDKEPEDLLIRRSDGVPVARVKQLDAYRFGSEAGTSPFFYRTCDVVFTALTPRVLVDVPYKNLAWAEGPDRMYRQPQHGFERARMLELALKVRDG